jgi:hypothetical protein
MFEVFNISTAKQGPAYVYQSGYVLQILHLTISDATAKIASKHYHNANTL